MNDSEDTEDPEPSPRRLARGAALANVGGALGNVWATCSAPNSLLLLLFVSEWLHGEKWHIGLILALTNLGPTLEPAGAWLMERLGRRKPLFLATHLGQRIPFLLLALIPLLQPTPANLRLGLGLVFTIVVATRLCGHLGAAAWWSWMSDLVPARRRSHWLGCRFQSASGMIAASFLAASLLMHHFGGMHNPLLVSGLFAAGALFGIADILLYLGVPEVAMRERRPCRGWRDFLARAGRPFRQPNFRRFLLSQGLWLFGVNLVVPFIPLYLKGDVIHGRHVGLGVTWTYLAAFQVLGQIGTMASSRWWGRRCPRFGAKQLIHIGACHLFVQLVLLIIQPAHYHAWLLVSSLTSGALLGAWQVGSQQMLYEMTPVKNRGFYTSAYNMANGWGIAAGSLLGGILASRLGATHWTLPTGLAFAYLHVLLLIGVAVGAGGLLLLSNAGATGARSFSTLWAIRAAGLRAAWHRWRMAWTPSRNRSGTVDQTAV